MNILSVVVFTFQTEGRYNIKNGKRNKKTSCFYLSNRRQIQQQSKNQKEYESCFYLSNRRQIQLLTAICAIRHKLFLPFKQKADTTLPQGYTREKVLFLPFKQKADTTRQKVDADRV